VRMYCCQATVMETSRATCTINPETKSTQVPTFYLHPNVQGIVDIGHAERIAKDVVNPSHDPNVEVQVSVVEVDIA